MSEAGAEVQQILSQIEAELTALVTANEIGMITVHCGVNQLLVEVHRKRDPVKLTSKLRVPVRRGWE
jgi:hypothetical protein